jgi:hypothetical protein
MTPKELLIPRYRLYAEYPGCPFKRGAILIEQQLGATNNPFYEDGMFGQPNAPSVYNPGNYPHNFEKMAWHEKRHLNDFPDYLRDMQGDIYKLEVVTTEGKPHLQITDIDGKRVDRGWIYLTPATKEEYNQYKTKHLDDLDRLAEGFINQFGE